jgi:hypothetical protein
MHLNVTKEVASLRKLPMQELRARYAETFGESTNANNKAWLVKRIAWRLQANAEGNLSERAQRRAAELANDADLRLSPPKPKEIPPAADRTVVATVPLNRGERLPPPGSVLTRAYKGETLHVTVLADGFEYEGERYKSLSAVAKAITGQHCNGYLFFRLTKGVA